MFAGQWLNATDSSPLLHDQGAVTIQRAFEGGGGWRRGEQHRYKLLLRFAGETDQFHLGNCFASCVLGGSVVQLMFRGLGRPYN